jgi:hypothetical protein
MYCRVTEIRFDHTKKDEIITVLEGFRESVMALPGIQSVCTIETGEGEITSFAVYDTQENFNTASAEVMKIMGGFAAYFTAPPVGKEGATMFYLNTQS